MMSAQVIAIDLQKAWAEYVEARGRNDAEAAERAWRHFVSLQAGPGRYQVSKRLLEEIDGQDDR